MSNPTLCSAAYNVAFACKITSSLDANALRAAFQMIVDRHSCLRTTYTQGRSGPVQVCLGQGRAAL
jgi:hypothetical protein